MHGRPQKFFQGGATSIFAYPFSGCERCNANGPTQNALPFLHHKENSPWKHALHSHWFEIVFRWSCIRVYEEVIFLSSFTDFPELGYHPISLLLWTADNWVRTGPELSTSAFAVLTSFCAGWTSLLKIQSEIFSTLWLSEMLFLFINYSMSIFRALSEYKSLFQKINDQNTSSGGKNRKVRHSQNSFKQWEVDL